jgi:phosphoribosylformylglycinamidine cyclo-ligase
MSGLTDGKKWTYEEAGVNITAGNETVELIKDSVRRTWRPEVLTDIGGFGGLFALNTAKYRDPVLVSGTDGVGTKLRVAIRLISMTPLASTRWPCVSTIILVQGAEPLFSWIIWRWGKLVPEKAAGGGSGGSEGCRQARLRLDRRRDCRDAGILRGR